MDELQEQGKILIKTSEINTLRNYGILIDKCTLIDEVLFLIDNFLNETSDLLDSEYEELDLIANNLMERKYYGETNK